MFMYITNPSTLMHISSAHNPYISTLSPHESPYGLDLWSMIKIAHFKIHLSSESHQNHSEVDQRRHFNRVQCLRCFTCLNKNNRLVLRLSLAMAWCSLCWKSLQLSASGGEVTDYRGTIASFGRLAQQLEDIRRRWRHWWENMNTLLREGPSPLERLCAKSVPPKSSKS